MENSDFISEPLCEQGYELRRERYLGHHNDDTLSVAEHALDQLHEHTRFARAGYAVEQADMRIFVAVLVIEIIASLILLV